jgi:hypothetical protein
MTTPLDETDLGSRLRRLTALVIAAVGTASMAVESSSSSATSDRTLPRNVIVPLSAISRFFPDVVREASTSRNVMAAGKPQGHKDGDLRERRRLV